MRLPVSRSLVLPTCFAVFGLIAAQGVGLAQDDAKSGKSDTAKAASSPLKSDAPKIPVEIRDLLENRQYPQAIAAIDTAMKVKDAPRDYLEYLKARALHLQQKYDDAVAAYELLEKEFPKSVWAQRAKFGRAVSLARKGDFGSAEGIYREEAQRLLSPDRKQEIAELYLEFADVFFQPKDELQHPADYAKALEFYNKALEVGPKPETRIRVKLNVARCLQKLNRLPEAANEYQQFVKDAAGTPQEIEARFSLGEVQMAMNQPAEARRTWQDLLTAHADDKSERIPEATFKIAETYGLPTPPNRRIAQSRRGGARKLFEKISRSQAGGTSEFANRPKLRQSRPARRCGESARSLPGR